jgi:carbamoyltransferase
VMWLNADDYLLPGAIAKIAAFALTQPAADVIYGDCLFVDESKRVIRRKREHNFDFPILLFYGCYIPSTSTFIRRGVIAGGQLLDLDYRVCMDLEYYLRLSHAGSRFAYVAEPLAGFRWHDRNTSNVLARRRDEEWRRLQRHYLQLRGQAWLGAERFLRPLREVYRVKRVCKRFFAHGRPF